MRLKISLIALNLSFLFSCAQPLPIVKKDTKIYYLDPSQGLVRKQTSEIKAFKDSEGYLCVSHDDLEVIVQACQAVKK